jgi:F-type H+-transporting ATPase subunit a
VNSLTPDGIVYTHLGPLPISATLVFTWLVMALLAGGSWLITRRLSTGTDMSRWQNLLEVVVTGIRDQIAAVSRQDPGPYTAFVGTLFLFIVTANLLSVVPGFRPPTASLSTTTALALCVFLAVPLYGLVLEGPRRYLRHYIEPTPLMLPFNIIGELSRTLALAVRLYGNIMSGTVIAGILLSLAPFFFPVLMHVLGLITGMIQAYIFAILAMVYIASATTAHEKT